MTREPFLDTLLCLAKHLENESNSWCSNQVEARFLKQFPLETCKKLFPWLNLSTWESPAWERIAWIGLVRSEEHTSELQSLAYLVCRLLLEKKKLNNKLY